MPRARALLAPIAFSQHAPADNAYAKLIAAIDAGVSGAELRAKVTELKIGAENLFVQAEPESDPGNSPAGGGKSPS